MELFEVGTPRCGVRFWRLNHIAANKADAAARRPYQEAAVTFANYEIRVRLNKLPLRAVG